MKSRFPLRSGLALLAVVAAACPPLFAAERVTLRNGSEFDCVRRETEGSRIRLYLFPDAHSVSAGITSADANYIEISAGSVLRVELIPDPPPPVAPAPAAGTPSKLSLVGSGSPLTPAGIHQMLARAGALRDIDTDLLASVVKAESNGNARAVSPAGAQGLMQLMPATASDLGVRNSFAPDQNITGGTAYLNWLLSRYDPRDDAHGLELALAAYNAGPAAVDRYHGIPPYAETRAYVARVIREFNRRKRLAAANLNLTANAH